MVRIAICDDDKLYVNFINDIIEKNFNVKILNYFNGEDLVEAIDKRNNLAQIYIMDVELKGINGIKVSEKIRCFDKNAIIIFLTNYDRYVFNVFEVNAFRFISKNKFETLGITAINAAIEEINEKNRTDFIYIKNRENGILKIDYKDIIGFEKTGRYVEFSLKSGQKIRDNRTLKILLEVMDNNKFIIVQKGVVVNIENIIEFNENVLTMSDNSKRYISRNYMKNVKLLIARYWR